MAPALVAVAVMAARVLFKKRLPFPQIQAMPSRLADLRATQVRWGTLQTQAERAAVRLVPAERREVALFARRVPAAPAAPGFRNSTKPAAPCTAEAEAEAEAVAWACHQPEARTRPAVTKEAEVTAAAELEDKGLADTLILARKDTQLQQVVPLAPPTPVAVAAVAVVVASST